MDFMSFVNFYVLPGLVLGAIYAVGAIGITLVFGILRFAHFAHGDLATLGAFVALALVGTGLTPWAALAPAMLVCALLAVGLHRLFYAHLADRPRIVMVMASLGVALMLRAVVQMIWGTDPETYVRGIVRPMDLGGLRVRMRELLTLFSVVLMVGALAWFLARTRWGRAMRAMSDNPALAQLCGVPTARVTTLTWALAGALCAASGFLLGINTEVQALMGWQMLLPMFAAAILGGVGRIDGAVLGGLVVGLAEELSVLVLPAAYKSATAFALLLAILLLRPRGLLNGKLL